MNWRCVTDRGSTNEQRLWCNFLCEHVSHDTCVEGKGTWNIGHGTSWSEEINWGK